MTHNIQLNPIGYAHIENGRYYFTVGEPFRDALIQLDGFSHIHTLFWAHESDNAACRGSLVAKKPYKLGPEQIGVFATRSQFRPNPILMSIAPVLSVDVSAGLIEVAYHDALDGSPLLDIKPYLPSVDRVREVKVSDWSATWPSCYEDSMTFDWESVFNF